MGLREELLAVIDAVEGDLFAPWLLADLSRQAHLSKYHLHRLFKALCGMTPADYIWARRLSISLGALQDPTLKVTDIAVAHGFADGASYTHAFCRRFGLAPTAYRKQPVVLPVCDRLHPYDLVGDDYGVLFRPQPVWHPGFFVVGERYAIRYGENAATNKAYNLGADFFFQRRHQIAGALDASLYTGLTIFPEDDDSFTWYLPSLEVAAGEDPPLGMERFQVPSGTYAVFRYVGLHHVSQISRRMRPLFEHIYLTWMPQLSKVRIPLNYERIPLAACSTADYCEIALYYLLESRG